MLMTEQYPCPNWVMFYRMFRFIIQITTTCKWGFCPLCQGQISFEVAPSTFTKPHGNSQEVNNIICIFSVCLCSWSEKEISSVEEPLWLTAIKRPGGMCSGTRSSGTLSHCTASLRKSPITPHTPACSCGWICTRSTRYHMEVRSASPQPP